MSKKNSKARKALKRIYGDGCFVERAGIRTIKGVKKNARMITYHHLKHKSEGGKATIENGANVALENHEWLHSLPRDEEEKVNEAVRQWKINFLTMKNGEVKDSGQLSFKELKKEEDCIVIQAYDTTKVQRKELEKKKKEKFNRSQEKRKMQEMINELIDEGEIEL